MQTALTKPIHRITYRVLYGDTDAAGVVYNANYLRYFEAGRTELMREYACPYREIEDLGYILPVTECYTRFKAPAYYDDLIIIETSLTELKQVSCKFCYRVLREDKDSGKEQLLAKGFTVLASVNREGKLTRLPDTILSQLRNIL